MNGRLMMACCVLSCLAAAGGEACAQEDGSLGAEYARLLMLSSTDDISASSFRTHDGVTFSKFSLPYEVFRLELTDRLSLSGTVRGSYLKVKGTDDDEGMATRWDMFSAVSGLVGRYSVSDSVAIKSGIELGYAYMRNRISFGGHAPDDEYRWDMTSRNGLVAPMLGIEYANGLDNGDRIHAEGSLSWMHVSSFSTNSRLINIHNEKAGTWSLLGEYTFGDVYRLLGWPMDVIASNKLGGFYGKGYRDIDMGFMNNTELATGTRIRFFNQNYDVRVGVGYLINDNGQGISLVMRMN
ncbi:hypothetical protein I5M82_12275 [Serratia marcescens]|jgi:hypothetical protein|uniref:hypothetical protein n=1 Tax=Serratia bockelmannii TaxID=2703793 RepID=UPI0018D9423E|nr:hypothetical protein [Serratia marcescens]HEJ0404576.1 hypothetical protein [Serratia marcescens]HEJ7314916.1 hypothetical protein [Serratia marcescens]